MFKPMLACSTIPVLGDITYPVLASPKMDGIRCLIIDGVPVSRNLKPIPNDYIRNTLTELKLNNLDGELMLIEGDFNKVQSAVMKKEGKPKFVYIVFDCFKYTDEIYYERVERARQIVYDVNSKYVNFVETVKTYDANDLEVKLNEWLKEGYEGAIVRDMYGPYKFGRSTYSQGWMLKIKKFVDDEAEIKGFTELEHNYNTARKDNLGRQTRSTKKSGKHKSGVLGAFVVEYNGKTFNIGSGFTEQERKDFWKVKESLIGSLVTFRYQELSRYGVPRFPVYKSIRNKADL